MIVTPRSLEELSVFQRFMADLALIKPAADTVYVGWEQDGLLVLAVAFSGFIGRTCQIHIAMLPEFHYTPREMLKACFTFAFSKNGADRDMLLGIVNSNNTKAMRFDKHLGFEELYRIPELHDDGGDLVLLGMKAKDCKYFTQGHAHEQIPSSRFHQAGLH